MIAGYGKVGDVGGAEKVFGEVPGRMSRLWVAMIACYSQNGWSTEAIGMYKKMRGTRRGGGETTGGGGVGVGGQRRGEGRGGSGGGARRRLGGGEARGNRRGWGWGETPGNRRGALRVGWGGWVGGVYVACHVIT
ncbi:hypothetical protein Syun_016610 [Stephania yunnanensis]|uniref:Pentatricopeptide repeat-containing protein n=1 Tax=Stephania yunnanensis TaxID=152371 RepID=A0AAP0J5J1_9MAGN